MYHVQYVPSESFDFQGKEADAQKWRKKGYIVKERGAGGGNWKAMKLSDAIVNGESYREFVLEHYKRDRLNEALAKQFEDDLNAGNVKL